jgi:hypothetical protein
VVLLEAPPSARVYEPGANESYIAWLSGRTTARVEVHEAPLPNPTDDGAIYRQSVAAIEGLLRRSGEGLELTFHLSPED